MNLQENIQRIREMMGLLTEEEQGNYSTILIFGPQGVGKSTLTKPLGKRLGMEVINTDEKIRGFQMPDNIRTKKELWNSSRDFEFDGMKKVLNDYLGKPVIIDIGGSHGVWEGKHLEEIKSMISQYPNTFLLLPTENKEKSKEHLRKNLLKREHDMEGAIEYWKKLLEKDENWFSNNGYEKEDYLDLLEKVKNNDKKTIDLANYWINKMQTRLDLAKSGDVNWVDFDINDEESELVKPQPDYFEDKSDYFIDNMTNSGIANHTIYNLDKDTNEVIDDIIKVLK
jgi:shikimate kinase